MEQDILGAYIKEIHKIKDEMLAILTDVRDMYNKIIANQEAIIETKADIVKVKEDVEKLKEPKE